jgi:hypothetical protein
MVIVETKLSCKGGPVESELEAHMNCDTAVKQGRVVTIPGEKWWPHAQNEKSLDNLHRSWRFEEYIGN